MINLLFCFNPTVVCVWLLYLVILIETALLDSWLATANTIWVESAMAAELGIRPFELPSPTDSVYVPTAACSGHGRFGPTGAARRARRTTFCAATAAAACCRRRRWPWRCQCSISNWLRCMFKSLPFFFMACFNKCCHPGSWSSAPICVTDNGAPNHAEFCCPHNRYACNYQPRLSTQ